MKKPFTLFFILIFTIVLASCGAKEYPDIIATMFPQYDFAKQIAGDDFKVSLLVPPGTEIHEYEVTSQDMVKIKKSKLFIFTSLEIDNWIGDVNTIGGDDTIVMNLSEHYTRVPLTYAEPILIPLDEEAIHANTLHFWTDPANAVQLIEAILEQMITLDPSKEDEMRVRAQNYISQINESSNDFTDFMDEGSGMFLGSILYFAGHNALGSFGQRYGLNIISLFEDFKPDADLTSNELIIFTNLVKNAGTHFLFIEELVEPKAARAIQLELSVKYQLNLLELHGYHNVSVEDFEQGVSYKDLLDRNITNIKQVLFESTLL